MAGGGVRLYRVGRTPDCRGTLTVWTHAEGHRPHFWPPREALSALALGLGPFPHRSRGPDRTRHPRARVGQPAARRPRGPGAAPAESELRPGWLATAPSPCLPGPSLPRPMEQLLRAELRTATLRAFGSPGAGCISEGRAYDTDAGPVFVKVNHRTQVRPPRNPLPRGLSWSLERGRGGGGGAQVRPGVTAGVRSWHLPARRTPAFSAGPRVLSAAGLIILRLEAQECWF